MIDHLSRLENVDVIKNKQSITETFPDKQLMAISERPWFSDMENYKATITVPEKYTWQQRKHLYKEDNLYPWDETYVFKIIPDGLLRWCVAGKEADSIMWHYHNSTYEGYHRERESQLRYYIMGFGCQLYSMTVSYMFLHAMDATKRVTSQNDMICL